MYFNAENRKANLGPLKTLWQEKQTDWINDNVKDIMLDHIADLGKFWYIFLYIEINNSM